MDIESSFTGWNVFPFPFLQTSPTSPVMRPYVVHLDCYLLLMLLFVSLPSICRILNGSRIFMTVVAFSTRVLFSSTIRRIATAVCWILRLSRAKKTRSGRIQSYSTPHSFAHSPLPPLQPDKSFGRYALRSHRLYSFPSPACTSSLSLPPGSRFFLGPKAQRSLKPFLFSVFFISISSSLHGHNYTHTFFLHYSTSHCSNTLINHQAHFGFSIVLLYVLYLHTFTCATLVHNIRTRWFPPLSIKFSIMIVLLYFIITSYSV
ncbi:hypothetical protein L218DRAFT_669315 [Marasmius fiardii PR-910]|nr:hypothetical protein L218DRAFT_669315 [Marasmius fiardii PR-910]